MDAAFKVGDSVQVVTRDGRTRQLWRVVGHHAGGSLKWESLSGWCTFLDSDRKCHALWVEGLSWLSRQYKHDTTASMEHFTTGEMVYGGVRIFHRVRPETDRELARERIAACLGLA